MELQRKEETDQQLTCSQHTRSLIACLEAGDKMQLAELTSQLLPKGKPAFDLIRMQTPIAKLCEQGAEGRKVTRMMIFLLVKTFCDSLNLVRNMNEDQMIEAAAFLLDECGDFRLEDYQVMFTMAKRGQLVDILDRMDIQVIGKMVEVYWHRRNAFANKEQDSWYSDVDFKPSPVRSKEADPEQVSTTLSQFIEKWNMELEEDKAGRQEKTQEEIDRRQRNILRRRLEFESKAEGDYLEYEDNNNKTDQT